jgi:O-antigen/teichoic acid export membrane protein
VRSPSPTGAAVYLLDLRRWVPGLPRVVGSAAWAGADQVAVSLARFGVAWTLARWASSEEYGTFVVCTSILLLLEILQAALVTLPLTILGADKELPDLRRLVAVSGALQLSLGLALTIALLVTSPFLSQVFLHGRGQGALVATAVAIPFLQAAEFVRRVLLTRSQWSRAFVNSSILGVSQIVAVALLGVLGHQPGTHAGDWLIAGNAIWLSALSGALACSYGLYQIRDAVAWSLEGTGSLLRETWRFGRWILGSRVGDGLLNNTHALVVAHLVGTAGAASLDAPRLIVAPLQVVLFALVNLALPSSVRAANEGQRALKRVLVPAIGGIALVAGLYLACVSAWPAFWLRQVYGGHYLDSRMLRLWAVAYMLMSVRGVLTVALYATRRSDLLMYATLPSGLLSLAAALPLALHTGALGAVWARVFGELLLLSLVAFLAYRILSRMEGERHGA